MFEFIRNHKRLMQILLMLLIVPSFAFVGIEGYSNMRDRDNAVAKVGSLTISPQEWDTAQREQMERFQKMLGAQFDPKMFDTPEAKQSILDNLIAQKALATEMSGRHLAISDELLLQTVRGIDGLTKPDGQFDKERYTTLLAAQGMTPAGFEARLRQDMALQQLVSAVQSTAFSPKSVSARVSEIGEQEREIAELTFKSADYASQVALTPAMLKDYYTKNAAQFQIPEQVKIEYVVLSAAAVSGQINVSDAEIKAFFDQNAARYTVAEQRRASHILINAKKGAPAAEIAAAKAKAEALLAQVRKNPADFAKLAKENSQDTGSAAQGGDLDFFGKGMMVKPFEETVFKMKPGQISDLVQSDFGFHIIELTAIKPASVKSLAEVKDDITAEIKKQQVAKKYAELAEQFSNAVYEQADSLKPVADKLKLKIETASGVTRLPSPALAATPMLNNEKFLKAVFADDSIKNKRNTEAVEVAPNTLVAAHVVEYKPTSKRAFDDVQNAIKTQLTQIEAASLAKKAGMAKLAALKKADNTAGFSPVRMVSRGKAGGLTEAGLTAVMRVDGTKLPAYTGVEGGGSYSIYRVSKIVAPAPDVARRQAEQQQVAGALAQQEMAAYVEFLKQKAKVQILKNPATLAVGGHARTAPVQAPE